MKKYLMMFIAATSLAACGNKEEQKQDANANDSTEVVKEEVYKAGAELTEDGALTSADFLNELKGKDSVEVKLSAKINAVCQAKGCWMRLDLGNDQELMVKFKDYEFFVPKDASGKTAIVQGWAKVDTISVAELKHYAEDDGQSKEEIDAIKEPKAELTFVANGVMIKK